MTKMFFNKMKVKAGISQNYGAQAKILDNHLKKKYQDTKEIWADQEDQ
jgi:hypothetical protein